MVYKRRATARDIAVLRSLFDLFLFSRPVTGQAGIES